MTADRPIDPGAEVSRPALHRHTAREEETRALGRELAARLAPDGVLLLSGDLGSGKTVLAQGVASGLGIDPAEVQSPTYTLIREHEGEGGRLVHVDLYRLSTADEVLALGLEEALAGPGVKVVEWAERLPFPVPGALRLTLARHPAGREIREMEGESSISRRIPKPTGAQQDGRGRPSPPLREGEGSGE